MAVNLQDLSYNIGGSAKEAKLDDVLQLLPTIQGRANNYKNGSTLILNSDRLILNSKADYAMLCGKEGVMITSPKTIHLDCDEDIHIFSNSEVYIGLPNKGAEYDFDNQKQPKNKAQATVNSRFEPMVLGLKLANLLEDLLVLVKNATIITPAGKAFMGADTMYNLACLQARLPEILSTYAFIDGVSHEGVDPEPPGPAGSAPTTSTALTPGNAGSATSTNQVTGNTTTQNNTSSAPKNDVQAQMSAVTGGNTAPAAANPGISNPQTPTNNPDGPPPSQATGWVPGQIIAQGSESPNPQTNPPTTILWTVKKSDTPNLYVGTYIDLLGSPVTFIESDPNYVREKTIEGARAQF